MSYARYLSTSLLSSNSKHPKMRYALQWVLFGPPGVGKGTYAKYLAAWYHLANISTGDLLRKEIDEGSALGQKIRKVVHAGGLVDDGTMIQVLATHLERISQERAYDGFLLDGFPRTAGQAMALDRFVDINLALRLKLSEDILVSKLSARRLCTTCGGNFNLADINRPAEGDGPAIVMPPILPPTSCQPRCNLVQRQDDQPEVILKRLQAHAQQEQGVVQHYAVKGVLRDFDVSGIQPDLPRLQLLLDELFGVLPRSQATDTGELQLQSNTATYATAAP